MKVIKCDQYSDAWYAVREGIPTASSAAEIITPKTGKLSAQAEGYIDELLCERAGFVDDPRNRSKWELRGKDMESEARAFFEFDTGLEVVQVGFVTNDDGTAGCSPDGLIHVDPESGFEVKCPMAKTHMGYLRRGALPDFYRPQVHWGMAVSGLNRWWFMSYYPGLDPLIVKVTRDEYTEAVAKALAEFVERLEAESRRLGLAWREAA